MVDHHTDVDRLRYCFKMFINLSLVRNSKNIPLLFTEATMRYTGSQYRPFSFVVVSLLKTFAGGDDILFWRLSQISLHILNAILLFLFIFILTENYLLSILSSTIFLAHPMATPAVNIIENIHYLFTLSFFLSFSILTTLFLKTKKILYYLAALILFIIGLFNFKIMRAIKLPNA